ncbi:MAG: hypothetical protein ACTSQG_07945, partial [Promethearchaeota archaeon]
MERERQRETSEKKIEELRRELAELRERKRQKELMEQKAAQIVAAIQDKEENESEIANSSVVDDLEERLKNIDTFLTKELDVVDQKTFEEHSKYIDSELQALEEEIVGEKGLIEKVISPYEQIIKDYPWLEEKRYEFMYTLPDKKKNPGDFESWKTEWAKVLFDYAKYAILHILFIRKLNSEKPFSNFTNREDSIKEIAEKLIAQKLAKWLTKKKDQLRVYWKTLEEWA